MHTSLGWDNSDAHLLARLADRLTQQMTREIEERDAIIQDPLSQVVVPSIHIHITNNHNRLILAKAMSDEFFFFSFGFFMVLY